MVKHIILWKLKEEYSEEKKQQIKAEIKEGLEGLAGQIPVMGLPGCVMYAKRTIFDLVLPRIMCDEKLHEKDFRLLGQGGLCLSCPVCTFPNCGFGKGGY